MEEFVARVVKDGKIKISKHLKDLLGVAHAVYEVSVFALPFFGRMNCDGRLTIRKPTLGQDKADEENLMGQVLEVTIRPTAQ